MSATVLIKDIIEALQMHFDELSTFLNLDTGELEIVHNDLLDEAEEDPSGEPDLPDWQEHEWEIAKRIVSTDRFLSLPDKSEVNEWEIMEDFANSRQSTRLREDLLDAIHGSGAYRNFKQRLHVQKIEEEWYAFRDNALTQIAIEWCKENEITWR
jgi:hypothetical protein